MNAAISHWGRQNSPATTRSWVADVGRALAAFAVVWLATGGMTTAASVAPTWSLLPQPAHAQPDGSSVVRIADGALVAVRGADRRQVRSIADRFVQLVAGTRGLQLHAAAAVDLRSAITFEVDPHASVVGD